MTAGPAPTAEPTPVVHDSAEPAVHEPVAESAPRIAAAPVRASRGGGRRKAAARPRRRLADYVRAASEALDSARDADELVDVTPGWCRLVTST
ncbi:hypothetical protein FVA95_29635, partial [Pseudonocardia sp. EV170527-09]